MLVGEVLPPMSHEPPKCMWNHATTGTKTLHIIESSVGKDPSDDKPRRRTKNLREGKTSRVRIKECEESSRRLITWIPIQSSGAMSPVTNIKVTENKIVSKACPPYTGITCRKHGNVTKRIML